ncbi:PilZ domain-containing protein [Candidatus Pelagadaptatus aseana]|uniref:PilZ domain-containing protein n=1 Tax=Candidatus Pelagadaptatus aseana TaxID=3120508 RepID=UPI003C6FA82E
MAADAERRHFSRVSFHGHALLKQGATSWKCELLDISINGLLVVPPRRFSG